MVWITVQLNAFGIGKKNNDFIFTPLKRSDWRSRTNHKSEHKRSPLGLSKDWGASYGAFD